MDYKQFGNKYLVRIDKGEEIVDSLRHFAKAQNISLGSITAIGAVSKTVLRFFDFASKKYSDREFNGGFEITNFTGNISTMSGEVYLHCHMSLSDSDYNMKGGHVLSAVVGGTFEAVIEKIEGSVDRTFDEETGLNLYKF